MLEELLSRVVGDGEILEEGGQLIFDASAVVVDGTAVDPGSATVVADVLPGMRLRPAGAIGIQGVDQAAKEVAMPLCALLELVVLSEDLLHPGEGVLVDEG